MDQYQQHVNACFLTFLISSYQIKKIFTSFYSNMDGPKEILTLSEVS